MHHCKHIAGFLAALVVLLFSTTALAGEFKVPDHDGWVTDTAGVLSDATEKQLESDIAAFEKVTSHEIAVLIVPSLNGNPAQDVAYKVFNTWGIVSS